MESRRTDEGDRAEADAAAGGPDSELDLQSLSGSVASPVRALDLAGGSGADSSEAGDSSSEEHYCALPVALGVLFTATDEARLRAGRRGRAALVEGRVSKDREAREARQGRDLLGR